MHEFDGITFGIGVQSSQSKKHTYYGEVKPNGWHRLYINEICGLGPAAWLVNEKRCMETVRWGNSAEHYIIYDIEE